MVRLRNLVLLLIFLSSLIPFISLIEIVDLPFFILFFLLYILGFINEFFFRIYIPRYVINALGILFTLFFLLQVSIENLIAPFANIVLLLLSAKALEEKKPRDMYQILILSLFGVSITATFNFDISFLLLFIYEVFLGTISFLLINLYSHTGDREIPKEVLIRYFKFTFVFIILVIIFTVPFFILLPRAQAPFVNLFAEKKKEGLITGLTDRVEIGKVGDIQEDNTVVMRVYGEIPEDPYWRVSVFDTYYNRMWVRTVDRKENDNFKGIKGEFFTYTVILNPTYEKYIPALDYPLRILKVEGLKGRIRRLEGGILSAEEPVIKPIRYRMVSVNYNPETLEEWEEFLYLSVPEDIPESIRRLAEELTKDAKSDEEAVRRIVNFFSKGFSYTLKLEEYEGDPLEHFLFRSKKGNCEYFASATAILLRLSGIPARVVGGFKGYIKNEYGNYYIVTNSMAHVWVEAFVNGRWIRIDTTPPYFSPALKEISKIDLLVDAIVTFWYRNIVDFSVKHQRSIFAGIVEKFKTFNVEFIKEFAKTTLKFLSLFLVIFIIAYIYLNYVRKTPENLYKSLIRKLEKMEKRELKGKLPEDILKLVKGKPYYREVEFIVRLYQQYRFSPYGVSEEELEEGYKALQKLH